ncbi:MAG: RHS repeat domain-containing protein, partial [Planctomycetia bacterium]
MSDIPAAGMGKLGGGGQFGKCCVSSQIASLGLMTATSIEPLEDRTVLDGPDPYGGTGSNPNTGGTGAIGGTGSTGGTGATGGTGGSYAGGTMAGQFLSSANGGVLRPNGQQWFETFGTDPLSGVVAVHRDLPGGLTLNYSSDTVSLLPIVTLDTSWMGASLPTGPITATLKINGTTQSSVVIDQTGIAQGTPFRISLQVTSALPAGHYDASIDVSAPIGTTNMLQALTQSVNVEDRSNSPFGKGWTLTGLESIVPQADGNLWINGAGMRVWFNTSGVPMTGMMPNSALTKNTDGSFQLSLADGSVHNFDTAGRILSKVDAVGNTITYQWNSTSGLLTSVTDAVGRATLLQYSSGRLSQVTDFGGRYVLITQSTGGQLLTISSPAVQQVGAFVAPVMTYTYNASGLLATLTDAMMRQTSLTYSFAGTAATATLSGGAVWAFAPAAIMGLVNPSTGSGTTTTLSATLKGLAT